MNIHTSNELKALPPGSRIWDGVEEARKTECGQWRYPGGLIGEPGLPVTLLTQPPLPPGTRVRAVWQQYPEAYAHGTADIITATHCHTIDGSIEYDVKLDGGTITSWNRVYKVHPRGTSSQAGTESVSES